MFNEVVGGVVDSRWVVNHGCGVSLVGDLLVVAVEHVESKWNQRRRHGNALFRLRRYAVQARLPHGGGRPLPWKLSRRLASASIWPHSYFGPAL